MAKVSAKPEQLHSRLYVFRFLLIDSGPPDSKKLCQVVRLKGASSWSVRLGLNHIGQCRTLAHRR